MRPFLLLALLPAAASAQVVVGPGGVRVGGTRVDSSGVHTAGADVTSRGVVTGGRGRGGTVIRTNGNTRTVDCRGGSLSLDGNGNHLNATRCSRIDVNGNGNVVAANFPAPGRLQVVGNRNQVSWRSAAGVRVAVTNVGTGNGVSRR